MTENNPVSSEYDQLYHYTDMAGAIGIIDSQKLWNTDLKFTNDISEGQIARAKLEEAVLPHLIEEIKQLIKTGKIDEDKIMAEGGLDFLAQKEVKTLVDACYSAMGGAFYITSMCGKKKGANLYEHENGLLSQWRGYGTDGGVAIVFNTKEIEEILKKEGEQFLLSTGLADVLYDFNGKDKDLEEEAARLFNSFVEYAVDQFNKVCFNESLEINEEIAERAYRALLQIITRYKHQGFKEENEVRIYTHRRPRPIEGNKKEVKPLKFRGPAIPYMELFDSEEIVLPIEKVIVGPHRDKDRRAEGLRALLKEKDIDVDVTVSAIPYIE